MNIYELIDIFADFKVCSGFSGMGNNIAYITVMDAPDIYNWMHGGEFLITSGYVFKNEPENFVDLIIKLKEKNIAALGIKIDRFIKEIPKSVLEISNKLGLPVIYIPTHYAFSDIISPGLTEIVNRQYNELYKAEKIHKDFINIGLHNDINEILKKLYNFINKDILFYNLNTEKIISTKKEFEENFKLLNNEKLNSIVNKSNEIYIRKIEDENIIYGYILIKEKYENLTKLDIRTIEYAETMIKLYIQKEISNNQIKEQYKDQFILDILLNNIKTENEIKNKANIYNWNFGPKILCLIIKIKDIDKNNKNYKFREEIFKDIKKYIFKINKKSYYMSKVDSLVYIVNFNEENEYIDKLEKKLGKLVDLMKKKYNISLFISVGNECDNISKIYNSYNEALITLNNGHIFMGENKSIIKYRDIDIYWKFMNFIKNNNYIRNEEDNKLYILEEHDTNNKTEYFKTLNYIIEADWNLKIASENMYIHYNTIKYRFSKIKDILNCDLNDRNTKFKLEMAVYINKVEKINIK